MMVFKRRRTLALGSQLHKASEMMSKLAEIKFSNFLMY